MPVGELASKLPVGRPAVSKHLRVLESAGLVEHRSQGTRNLYALAPEGLVGLQQWLVAVWDTALSSFADYVETDGQADTGRTMTVAPIRREILVSATPDRAFALFTAHIGRWWPLRDFSVFGADALVAFEGDRLVERSGSQVSVWAEVLEWDPPAKLRLRWHPGRDAARATDLHVSFAAHDDGTMVTLVHGGWERVEDPAATAEEYGHGWPAVLAAFEGWAVSDTSEASWFALHHRAGPALPDGESVFAQPAFAEHVAFLERLNSRGSAGRSRAAARASRVPG